MSEFGTTENAQARVLFWVLDVCSRGDRQSEPQLLSLLSMRGTVLAVQVTCVAKRS